MKYRIARCPNDEARALRLAEAQEAIANPASSSGYKALCAAFIKANAPNLEVVR